MIRNCLGVVLVAFCLISFAAKSADENPYKKAKVGDWVEYKMANKVGGFAVDTTQKKTVVKVSDTEVTLELETNGAKIPITIKLDQKYDPTAAMKDAKVTKTGEGAEKLDAAGKSVDTKWTSTEVVTNNMTIKSKVWMSTDVPLDGIVKMESDMGGNGKMLMELTGYGSGK